MGTTLTKSRFKIALECPRKLAYATNEKYANAKSEDDFLQALAEGGHQIGALAKLMHPGGVEVTASSIEEQIKETEQLLEQDVITIFEPTFRHGNLVIRVDVLVKKGHLVDLIEVKAKGFNPEKDTFRGKRQPIDSEWKPYLYDVAFQTLVLERAHPEWVVTPYLMLLDPSAKPGIDGLGSSFRVIRNGRRISVSIRGDLDLSKIREYPLRAYNVAEEIAILRNVPVDTPAGNADFEELVDWLGDQLATVGDFPPYVGAQCKRCEFYCDPDSINEDCRSGWAECMEATFNIKADWPRSETVFGLSNHRGTAALVSSKVLLMKDIDESHLKVKEEPGLISTSKRHLLQVMESQGEGEVIHIEESTLRSELDGWKFPLHFIDFETTRPTLPFHSECRPNELLLFQFSHHVLERDGTLRHANQCLVAEPGKWPNSSVVRALRDALGESGTVIHWWDHEKTVLKEMKRQILNGTEADKDLLCSFIDSLLDSETDRLKDLGRLVLKTVFIKGTNGRSSIKMVLPAILEKSDFLKNRYGQPIYGTEAMPSLNFPSGWTWLKEVNGSITDPYRLLDPIFLDKDILRAIEQAEDEDTGNDSFVANGGGAIVAYAQLQDPDLSYDERDRLETQLKRYCELDTLAMVMVYEALSNLIKGATDNNRMR